METLVFLTIFNTKIFVSPLTDTRSGLAEAWFVSSSNHPVLQYFPVASSQSQNDARKQAIAYAVDYGQVSPTYLKYYCSALENSVTDSGNLIREITDIYERLKEPAQ